MSPPPDISELAGQGVAVVVATRDGELRPAVTRGWGLVLDLGADTLTLSVGAAAGSATLESLAAGSPIAVTLTRPTSYSSVQLKGRVSAVRPLSPEDRRRVDGHAQAFTDEVVGLGLEAAGARALVAEELVTVDIALGERYDQTPGLGAGERL